MNNLFIEPKKNTPEIDFNFSTCVLNLSGRSFPEDASSFFKPVFDWLGEFLKFEKKDIVVNFKLKYFNTSSSKALLDILDLLDDYNNKYLSVKVNWYYDKFDDDIKESGEEFAEDLNLPFTILEIKD